MLINNYSYINCVLGHVHSGLTNPTVYIKPATMRNYYSADCYITENIAQNKRDSFPTGTNPPYSYVLGDKGALLSCTTTTNGTGSITSNLSSGINIESNLTGSGDITNAQLSLVVSLVANLTGDGTITTADLVGIVSLATSLSGTGSLTAGLNVIAFMNAVLDGDGSVTADLKGTLSLAANIYVNQSEADVQQIVDGVWNALTASYNNPNTMGEVMNNMGAGADPWTIALPGAYAAGEAGYILGNLLANIPASVWDELKTSHVTTDSYGKIVQDLETIAKQIKALTSANL